jgi:iron complex transport system permease protein
MLSAATASIVGVLQFISASDDLQTFIIWSLGNVGSTSWNEIKVMGIIVFIGIAIAFSLMKPLNTWLLGESYAKSLGTNINRSRFWIVTATGLLTGSVTAFCGPVAFVGLAVPHLVRLLVPTSNHKILLPSVMIGGACLLLFCDIVSQLPGRAQILPLNAVTSIIGAPLVIWLVLKNKHVRV